MPQTPNQVNSTSVCKQNICVTSTCNRDHHIAADGSRHCSAEVAAFVAKRQVSGVQWLRQKPAQEIQRKRDLGTRSDDGCNEWHQRMAAGVQYLLLQIKCHAWQEVAHEQHVGEIGRVDNDFLLHQNDRNTTMRKKSCI